MDIQHEFDHAISQFHYKWEREHTQAFARGKMNYGSSVLVNALPKHLILHHTWRNKQWISYSWIERIDYSHETNKMSIIMKPAKSGRDNWVPPGLSDLHLLIESEIGQFLDILIANDLLNVL